MSKQFIISEEEKRNLKSLYLKKGLIYEQDSQSNLWEKFTKDLKDSSKWDSAFGPGNWEVETDNDKKYEVEIDISGMSDLAINVAMDKKTFPGYIWFASMDATIQKQSLTFNYDGNNYTVYSYDKQKSLTETSIQEAIYHFAKNYYVSAMSSYKKESKLGKQTATPAAPGAQTPPAAPGAQTPATETPATETPATETPATETPATETNKQTTSQKPKTYDSGKYINQVATSLKIQGKTEQEKINQIYDKIKDLTKVA